MSSVLQAAHHFEHRGLDAAKQQLIVAHARRETDWIEGSIDVIVALRRIKDLIPPTVTFPGWLMEHKVNFYNKNDLAALSYFAHDLDLTRKILIESTSRCYEQIWRAYKQCYRTSKFKPGIAIKRPRRMSSRTLFRAAKLGDEAILKLKGTTLDSAAEIDELIELNRGAAPGELTPQVRKLIDDAASGKQISALSVSNQLGRRVIVRGLKSAWGKRMLAAWALASEDEQWELILHLVTTSKCKDFKAEENKLQDLIDKHHKGKGA